MDNSEFIPEITISVAADPIHARAISDLTPSERDLWLRVFFADGYRRDIRRLMEMGVPGPEEDDD